MAAVEPFSQQEVLARALLERVKIMKRTSKTTSKSGEHILMRKVEIIEWNLNFNKRKLQRIEITKQIAHFFHMP